MPRGNPVWRKLARLKPIGREGNDPTVAATTLA